MHNVQQFAATYVQANDVTQLPSAPGEHELEELAAFLGRPCTLEEVDQFVSAYQQAHAGASAYEAHCQRLEALAAACRLEQYHRDPMSKYAGCASLVRCDCELCRES